MILNTGFDTKSVFGNINRIMEDKRVHLVIEGTVQGVFYRASARDKADSLGLTGYVMNLPDGSVEAVAEGKTDSIDEFIAWCRTGPPNARVSDVKITFSSFIGEFPNFHIKY